MQRLQLKIEGQKLREMPSRAEDCQTEQRNAKQSRDAKPRCAGCRLQRMQDAEEALEKVRRKRKKNDQETAG